MTIKCNRLKIQLHFRQALSELHQSVSDGTLDTLIGGGGSDYFRFDETGNLPFIELIMSDFMQGQDKKP
ncbi:MAG: hypothetical protein C0467_05400 [Planctomycetaceae bacterium]|nr:hypothetical protein [Planctomycetaceae bacterium]